MITIRQATYTDIPRIMRFIDEHWKKGHILARDRAFLEWMYVRDGEVSFAIAEEDDTILGLNGYIVYSHGEHPDMSGALWKVIRTTDPILGLRIADCIRENTGYRAAYGIGVNPRTAGRICRLNGEQVCRMKHFYRLSDRPDYRIAVVRDRQIPLVTGNRTVHIIRDEEAFSRLFRDEWFAVKRPCKDQDYLIWRYFRHPRYHYDVWAITDGVDEDAGDGDIPVYGLLITRAEEVRDRRALKIVDFIGEDEAWRGLGPAIDRILREKDAEYIDIYETGIADELLHDAGLMDCVDHDNIIPNYFAPFTQENVDIYCTAADMTNVYLYRGDGDQDRPS